MREYWIEYEHGMTIDRFSMKAENIYNLRKRLIRDYTPERGYCEYTFVIYDTPRKALNPYGNKIGRYLGTFYIYGTPKTMTYAWSVGNKTVLDMRFASYAKGVKRYSVDPKTGRLM